MTLVCPSPTAGCNQHTQQALVSLLLGVPLPQIDASFDAEARGSTPDTTPRPWQAVFEKLNRGASDAYYQLPTATDPIPKKNARAEKTASVPAVRSSLPRASLFAAAPISKAGRARRAA